MKALVITPTYNERENIPMLLDRIQQAAPGIHVLVVDDNSPDDTSGYVRERALKDGWIHLIERPSKMGLGTAYCTGFLWALERDYAAIIQMDADLSHDPEQIPTLLGLLHEYDLVIGSRYIKGVNVVNWPLGRLILSWSANMYAKILTGVPVWDLTGGYKCWKREVLANLDIPSIRSEGYSFQIETTFRAHYQGYRIVESPIVFVDRTEGSSKMSRGIIFEAVWMVPRLRLTRLLGRLRSSRGKPTRLSGHPKP